jgi:two-component system cell cycle sensor histidine kinase/response regulator CckA
MSAIPPGRNPDTAGRGVSGEPVARSGTILVVEDERSVRYLVRTLLSRQGYHVFEAESPDAAEQWLADHRGSLDLLISDVVMPGGTGPALYERVRRDRPALRVLFMSGYTEDASTLAPGAAAGGAFLQKPFTAEELVRRVREALDA